MGVLGLTHAAAAAENSTASASANTAANDYVELDGGGEATSFSGWWTYLEGTLAPTGNIDESGIRLRLGGAGGQYAYPSFATGGASSLRIYDSEVEGDVLAGYEWVFDNVSVMGLVGGDIQDHMLSSPDPDNPVQGTRAGATGAFEFEANPTSNTLLAAYGSYSTAFNTYEVDLRPGVQAFVPDIFVGPQVVFEGDELYSEWRVGAHVTGIKLGPVESFIAAGYLHDSLQGSGAYGTLEVDLSF